MVKQKMSRADLVAHSVNAGGQFLRKPGLMPVSKSPTGKVLLTWRENGFVQHL